MTGSRLTKSEAFSRTGKATSGSASADGALYRLKDEKFTSFTRKEGLASDLVRSVFEDRKSGIWIGTSEGTDLLNDQGVAHIRQPWASGTITTGLQDHSGRFWIGTLGQGLRTDHNGTYFPGRIITALLEGRDGSIWAGVLPGLVRILNGRVESIGSGTSIGQARIVALRQDESGAILAAEGTGVVHRIEGNGNIKSYSLQEGGCPTSVTSLYPDGPGAMWIGTAEGLCRLEGGSFHYYSVSDGLAEDQVSSILEDDSGYLWLSGFRGFSKISKDALRQYRRGANALLPLWFIEHANGAATSKQTPSAWKSRDGHLWFGSLRGLITIDTAAAQADPFVVPAAIEEVLVDRVPFKDPHRRLAANVRDIEFRFVGLRLGDSAGVRYKYQLEGYDTTWTHAGARRAAFYTNLPNGSYRFRVAAANGDGVWNEQAATFAFSKDAHWYETWWMRLLALAALASTAWLGYRTHVAGLQRRFEAVLAERNRIARELHDTVEQGLTAVMLQLDTVAAHWSTAPEIARKGLDLARNMARHCMGEARNAVRDLRSETSGDAVAALQRMSAGFQSAGSEIHFGVQGSPYPLPRDVETTLVRIGQEAVTNAVKHARATRIGLDVNFGLDVIDLRVSDNGVGFAAQPPLERVASGHFGLLGMRERANKVRGTLVIDSLPGRGTTIDLRVPVGKGEAS